MKVIFVCSVIILSCLAILVSSPDSRIDVLHEFTCPICGETFEAEETISQYQTGMRIDLKPLGAVAAPPPLPVCPSCGFVVYEQELVEDERQVLSEYVNSEEYQQMAKEHSSYYLLAKIYEQLERDKSLIAHMYLKASWQVEDNPDRCNEYLEESLKNLNAEFSESPERDEDWETKQVLAGELERRLGKFEEAKDRFMELKYLPEFQGNFLEKVIDFELILIQAGDTKPHELSEVEKANR
jgi:uncharacterized protein (DUF2225 family)